MKKMYDLLKEISFERLGGSKEEKKCADIIAREIKEEGLTPFTEDFMVPYAKIKKATLETINPNQTYNITGYGMSGNTPAEGITGEFIYIDNFNDVHINQMEGKIVLLNGLTYSIYKKLIKAKVLAFINTSGTIYDDEKQTDLNWNNLRERHYKNGKIIGVTMRFNDAEKLLLSNPQKIKIVLEQEETERASANLITEITGIKYPNEIIVFTAHYDSVKFSMGVYDNGTGSVTILQIMRYFKANPPLRTLRFIWCGSEEMGLLGSHAYVAKHKDELENIKLCINIDMTGIILGRDIAVCTAEMSLVNYLDYFAKEKGFSLNSSQGVYSSDSTPFADSGVPAISFARVAARGGATIHDRRDEISVINESFLEASAEFIIKFANTMVNAHTIPVPKSIPANMKEELDKYLGRKEDE